jgi:hypothetical protein
VGNWLVGNIINGIIDWFVSFVLGALNILWDLLSATIFQSPDVTVLPQVRTFAGTSLGIVNVCYVLAFLVMAIMVTGRDTIQSRYGPGELIPRLIVGLIAANFAIPLCSTVISLANAFTAALTSQDFASPESTRQLRTLTVASLTGHGSSDPADFLLVLIALLIAVLVGLLVVQWIVRLGVLVVAVGISPIALALHATPFTEGAAKLWWRTFLGTLATVVLQALALHTTLVIFLSPDANLPVLGLPQEPTTTMNLLIVVCLLLGILKIPGLMRRYITQTRPSLTGQIVRVVVIQQLTRGVTRLFK